MNSPVSYRLDGGVATIAMDDGKVNALSLAMFDALNGALDRAEADGAVVVLAGRDGVFSGGFDLRTLRAGGDDAIAMLGAGFDITARLLSFPTPVVTACTGHAIAMGVFLLLSCDHRIGMAGAEHRIVANEVAIGLTLPRSMVEVCRQRLTPAAFSRATVLAETFEPDAAVPAGFLDRVVPADPLGAAQAAAAQFATLDLQAHAATKQRVRGEALAALRDAIEADRRDLLAAR